MRGSSQGNKDTRQARYITLLFITRNTVKKYKEWIREKGKNCNTNTRTQDI